MLKFTVNESPTVGVEQEFHLIDPATGDLVQKCDEVMACLDPSIVDKSTHELFMSVLEWRSDPFLSVHDLEKSVLEERHTLSDAAKKAGTLLSASSSHPFANWREQRIVESDHYKWVLNENVYVARRLLSFGLHVHVGMKSGDAALYVQNEMRRWLYPLLALSSNSPYFEGELTGLASTRYHLFSSMPRTGIPPEFGSYEEIETLFNKLCEAGDTTAPGDLWWSMRIQPPLGTLETRVFDLPTRTRRVAALTALMQAAAAEYQERFEAGTPLTPIKREHLEENMWTAMRHGLDGTIIEPASTDVIPMREQVRALLELAEPKMDELGSLEYTAVIDNILDNGTEAELQVKAAGELDGDLGRLELKVAELTLSEEA